MIISAARVFPITSPSAAHAAVRVTGGVIREVGPVRELVRSHPGEKHLAFPDSVLLPGLVNAHTHLEYSLFRTMARPTDFLPWIQNLVRASRLRNSFWGASHWEKSADAGIRRSLRSGITAVGDVVTFGASPAAALRVGIRMRAYLEAVALTGSSSEEFLPGLESAISSEPFRSPRIAPGLSPHSIYTLSPRALSALGSMAARHRLPLGIHVGETRHEQDLLRGRGPLAPQMRRWGLPFGPSYRRSLAEYLEDHGLLSSKTLLFHGVHLTDRDLSKISGSGATMVTCPRSNALLRCGIPDYQTWRKAGIRFVYGTDSLASVPDFDLFEEARMVRRSLPESGSVILRRLTLGAAEALGLARSGSLEPGKHADLALLRISAGSAATEEDVVTQGAVSRISATVVGGRLLYRRRPIEVTATRRKG
jgi:5-methylthioadenosine/S-adenosylhomocysteine deaminase